jgi:hypothetical protein
MTPMLNKRALLKLGYSPALITAILGKPDEVKSHAKGLKRWVEHLYAQPRAEAGTHDPRFTAVLEKRRRREQLATARPQEIARRYQDWTVALPEVCAGMFSLNRYAKHRMCSALHRVEIYQLKNELVALLWKHGYCTLSWIHVIPALECRDCAGSGEECDRCGGSGTYRGPIKLWCFRFLVNGKSYCWHQPANLVEFAPVESVPPQEWQGLGGEEKPVCLPKRKFAATKDLIRFVIDRAANPDSEILTSETALPFERPAFARIPACVEQQSLFPA